MKLWPIDFDVKGLLGCMACAGIVSFCAIQQSFAAEPVLPTDAAWNEIWNGHPEIAEETIRSLDSNKYRKEIELLHGAMLWEKHDYTGALQALSQLRSIYVEWEKNNSGVIATIKPTSRPYSEDELNYFRFYTYLALSEAASGKNDEVAESDFMKVLSNPEIAVASTHGIMLDTLTYFGATEHALGRYERALGIFLQVHYVLRNSHDLIDTEYARAAEYNIACVYARLHQTNLAIVWLKKSLVLNQEARWKKILSDKDFDEIRQDPAFVAFVNNRGKIH